MTKVTVDRTTRAKLFNLAEPLELIDEEGHLLGYYSPRGASAGSAYGNVEIPFSEEEIRQFKEQPSGRPLADIMAELQGRE